MRFISTVKFNLIKETHGSRRYQVCENRGVPSGFTLEGPCIPLQPSRKKYKTEGGYARAVERAFACELCDCEDAGVGKALTG